MHIILIDLRFAKVLPIGLQFPILMSLNNLLSHKVEPAVTPDPPYHFHQELPRGIQVL
jgi:hypothetical protein